MIHRTKPVRRTKRRAPVYGYCAQHNVYGICNKPHN